MELNETKWLKYTTADFPLDRIPWMVFIQLAADMYDTSPRGIELLAIIFAVVGHYFGEVFLYGPIHLLHRSITLRIT